MKTASFIAAGVFFLSASGGHTQSVTETWTFRDYCVGQMAGNDTVIMAAMADVICDDAGADSGTYRMF